MRALKLATLLFLLSPAALLGERPVPDILDAASGPILIIPIAHGTVEIVQGSHVVLVDPARVGPTPDPDMPRPPIPPPPAAGAAGPPPEPPAGWIDKVPVTSQQRKRFEGLSAPTLILVTHDHEDHFDPALIAALKIPKTVVIVPREFAARVPGSIAMANGQRRIADGLTVEAVAMYNTKPDPQLGITFHSKGSGNSYILTIGGKRFYFSGDTSCTPEMRAIRNIDVAFLGMLPPFTMSPEEATDCARAFAPRIVYPYHDYGEDVDAFESAFDGSRTEVRVRDWYVGAPAPLRPPQ
jgi:L-ascorbate metabolism protein UlaG (beta-lactamase superfamily)